LFLDVLSVSSRFFFGSRLFEAQSAAEWKKEIGVKNSVDGRGHSKVVPKFTKSEQGFLSHLALPCGRGESNCDWPDCCGRDQNLTSRKKNNSGMERNPKRLETHTIR